MSGVKDIFRNRFEDIKMAGLLEVERNKLLINTAAEAFPIHSEFSKLHGS